MRTQLEQRLKELKNEFQAGQKMLAELQAKEMNLRETLLRITGAIQVLEEELAADSRPAENGANDFGSASDVRGAVAEQSTLV
ncbi:hypothetical protein KJ068_06825 [bacterium]|nr:hypothetical protein [bacterium]